jgi:hypothetical protein
MFLPCTGKAELTEEQLSRRLDKLAAFSEALQTQYPGRFDEHQRIAIAQHYELETWLLDLSSDPWVALFFASLSGKTGDTGIVARFSKIEWDNLSCDGENALGLMTVIEVAGVPRIEAQKAAFLNSPHPDLITQYGAEELMFHQKDRLVFESEYWGVSKERLLSENDCFAAFAKAWLSVKPPPSSRPLGVRPRWSAFRPLSADDYREILQSLITRKNLASKVTPKTGALLDCYAVFIWNSKIHPMTFHRKTRASTTS